MSNFNLFPFSCDAEGSLCMSALCICYSSEHQELHRYSAVIELQILELSPWPITGF